MTDTPAPAPAPTPSQPPLTEAMYIARLLFVTIQMIAFLTFTYWNFRP